MAQKFEKLYVIAYYKKRSGIWSTAILHDASIDDAHAWNQYQTQEAEEETTLCLPSFKSWKRKDPSDFKANFYQASGE